MRLRYNAVGADLASFDEYQRRMRKRYLCDDFSTRGHAGSVESRDSADELSVVDSHLVSFIP